MLNLLMIAIGLSMDAFAVSTTNGMCVSRQYKRQSFFTRALVWSAMFGLFQGLMPMLGYFLGKTFASFISSIDHWIAFILLGFIGGKMLVEGIRGGEDDRAAPRLGLGALLVQGVATSIDALSVGFTIAEYDWLMALVCSLIIAAVTLCICLGGLVLGRRFGTRLAGRAQILGGAILIFIGLEIFISSFLS